MDKFAQTTAIINLIIVAQFLKVTYIKIFEYLLAAKSKYKSFWSLMLTYFGKVETNS